jgi:hypothetical protein
MVYGDWVNISEIFQHASQWFKAALLPTLKGIPTTRMEWVPEP